MSRKRLCFKRQYNITNSISRIFQLKISCKIFWLLVHFQLVWIPSVCYIQNYYMLGCVYLYFMPLFLHRLGNLLAYVAALFVASLSKLSTARGTDARTGDTKSLGDRIESAIGKIFSFSRLI